MRLPKTLLKRLLLIVIFAGLVFSVVLIFQLIVIRSSRTHTATPTASHAVFYKQVAFKAKLEKVVIDLPMRLMIPVIGVDTSIEHVGLTTNGEMSTPKDPYSAAWYKFGPSPGENGSAVIDGHYGLVNDKPAAFDNLYKLHTGDKLYVEDEQGTTIAFTVRKLQTYSRGDDSKGVFTSSDGKAHLNLITCAGIWDNASRNYSNRIVVFTDQE
jgi:LPXTG-site transpeptidase (sortase) family protein